MDVVSYACPNCNGKVEYSPSSQQWICDYCGDEFTLEEINENNKIDIPKQKVKFKKHQIYYCTNCGAKLFASEDAITSTCVYCDSLIVLLDKMYHTRVPDLIIPFSQTKDDVRNTLSEFLKFKFFVPKKFKQELINNKFYGVYVPFWSYDITVQGDIVFSAFKSYSCSMEYQKILSEATSKFSSVLLKSVEPYDITQLVPYDHAYLIGFLSQTYDISCSKAFENIQESISLSVLKEVSTRLKYDCSSVTPFNTFDTHINKYYYVLLPVWMFSVNYNNKKYKVFINGQTAKISGTFPISYIKLILFFILLFPILFIIIMFFNLLLGASIELLYLIFICLCSDFFIVEFICYFQKHTHFMRKPADYLNHDSFVAKECKLQELFVDNDKNS